MRTKLLTIDRVFNVFLGVALCGTRFRLPRRLAFQRVVGPSLRLFSEASSSVYCHV